MGLGVGEAFSFLMGERILFISKVEIEGRDADSPQRYDSSVLNN